MKINFETLFEQVKAAEVNTDLNTPGGALRPQSAGKYAAELVSIVALAKRDGVSGYQLIEAAFQQVAASRRAASESELMSDAGAEQLDAEDAEAASGVVNPPEEEPDEDEGEEEEGDA